jgi:hypothetical protein
MSYPLETIIIGNYKFIVERDEFMESPREWENLSTMLSWSRSYNSPDKNDFRNPDDFMEWFLEEHAGDPDHVLLPLFMYEHSGVSFSTGDFGDKWDSGQIGWVYATGESVRNWISTKEKAIKVLEKEVKEYSQWANGEALSWSILENNGCEHCGKDDWNIVESCAGYLGGITFDDIEFPDGIYSEFIEAVEKLLK